MSAASHPVGALWGCQQGLDLVAGELPKQLLVCALPGDGHHTCRDRDALGVPQCAKPKERPEGGQAHVPGADGVPAVVFQVVKKGEAWGGVQSGDAERGWRNPDGRVHKGQEEAEGVAAARDRRGPDAFLVAEGPRAKGLHVGRNAWTD